MLLNHDYTQAFVLITTYLVIYNLTTFLLFSSIFQVLNTNLKTLYSLSDFGATTVVAKLLIISILSSAGVPPLLGFFSKIFVLVLLTDSNLFILFPSLFLVIFMGLYFYVQNLRFLNTSSRPTIVLQNELSTRVNPGYFILALPTAFLLVFGFLFVDDVILISSWLVL